MDRTAHRVASRFFAWCKRPAVGAAERVAYRHRYARLFEAMSLEQAKEILGFPASAYPTDDEVNRALRKQTLQHHPDRGGDPAKMVELNVAADVLKGKQRPNYSAPEPSESYNPGPSRPKPEPVRVTWEEAERKAGVPGGARWKFKTQNAYKSSGDYSAVGFVVVGELDAEKYVYVAVEHFKHQNAFTGADVEEWWIDSKTYSGKLRDVAPKAIREMHNFPHVSKTYNAKVEILPEGAAFSSKLLSGGNRTVSFKDAMDILGELGDEDPWKNRKLQVTMQLGSKPSQDKTKWANTIELIINGRSHFLDERSVEKLSTGHSKVLRAIFGEYYYFSSGSGSKKVITKSKRGAEVLRWMVTNLPWEPKNILEALTAAADQMGGKGK